jgi:hypothetical protein
MTKSPLDRILSSAGVPELLEVLAERLEPTDLQSLLLEVARRRSKAVSPARLLEQYLGNRFVAPSSAPPKKLAEVDRLSWTLLPPAYQPLELSPVCPLGSNSAIATVDQNKVVSTIRNTEVVADSTNVLALECAKRRRDLLRSRDRQRERVLLAASHRLLRAQVFQGARSFAHFRVLSLAAAGRDEGSHRFEISELLDQIEFYLRLLHELARLGWPLLAFRVAVTALEGCTTEALERDLLGPLAARFPPVRIHLDPTRTSGRGYYRVACFKLHAVESTGAELELGDGGATDWTARLLSDRKERLVVSGLGVDRLCLL